jgi:hypothetical protein
MIAGLLVLVYFLLGFLTLTWFSRGTVVDNALEAMAIVVFWPLALLACLATWVLEWWWGPL